VNLQEAINEVEFRISDEIEDWHHYEVDKVLATHAIKAADFPNADQMVELAQVIHTAQDEHGLKTRHDIGLIVGEAIRQMLREPE